MKSITTLLFVLISVISQAETIYSKAFGKSENPAIIFLHGGPGYNCANFEATTAQLLADSGFYVIVYDRRGEGRSLDPKAKFTFKQTFDDLESIYNKYTLTHASLIGHSFGGIVATKFAEKYPKKVSSLVFVAAPVSFQSTLRTIILKSKQVYIEKNDDVNLNYISMLEKMDTSSTEYSSYCFMHAMQNGFYTPPVSTPEAMLIYSTFPTDTLMTKYASQMSSEAPTGFWENEKYTTIDLTESIQSVKNSNIPFYALYGKDDGLFSYENILKARTLFGEENVKQLNLCAHNVFIDQRSTFISSLKEWLK